MRHYFTDTHNVAEGAGAATLAALLKERDQMRGRRVGLVFAAATLIARNTRASLSARLIFSFSPRPGRFGALSGVRSADSVPERIDRHEHIQRNHGEHYTLLPKL